MLRVSHSIVPRVPERYICSVPPLLGPKARMSDAGQHSIRTDTLEALLSATQVHALVFFVIVFCEISIALPNEIDGLGLLVR